MLREIAAAESWHDHIAQQKIDFDRLFGDQEGFPGVARFENMVTAAFQDRRDRRSHLIVVFGQENRLRAAKLPGHGGQTLSG